MLKVQTVVQELLLLRLLLWVVVMVVLLVPRSRRSHFSKKRTLTGAEKSARGNDSVWSRSSVAVLHHFRPGSGRHDPASRNELP